MNSTVIKYGLIGLALVAYFTFTNSSDEQYDALAASDIDLNAVLDVTVDTLYQVEEQFNESIPESGTEAGAEAQNLDGEVADEAFFILSETLTKNYNAAVPTLHDKTIGVSPQVDSSLFAFEDLNANQQMDEGEDGLFMIEIDGQNARIIATSRSGAVSDHAFSGSGLLTGFLLGSILSRQTRSGMDKSKLSSKKPVTAKSAARARAGSGSHRSGK